MMDQLILCKGEVIDAMKKLSNSGLAYETSHSNIFFPLVGNNTGKCLFQENNVMVKVRAKGG